jgi:hypothetical protein
MFQGEKPLRTASPRCGRVEEVDFSVSVQLAPPIARAGRLIQVVPHTIQDDPRESSCERVTPGAAFSTAYFKREIYHRDNTAINK